MTATKRRKKKALAATKIPPTTSRALGLNLNIEPRATFASSGRAGSYMKVTWSSTRGVGAELVLELDGPAVGRLEPHRGKEQQARVVQAV